jgi:hypothetical protein
MQRFDAGSRTTLLCIVVRMAAMVTLPAREADAARVGSTKG